MKFMSDTSRRRKKIEIFSTTNKPRFINPYFSKQQNSDSNQNNKKNTINKGWSCFGIMVIVIGLMIYIAFFTDFFSITKIEVRGNKNLQTDQIISLTQDFFNTNNLYFFSNRNYLFSSNKKASIFIKDKIINKEIVGDITVEKKWPNQIFVNITERVPGLILLSNNEYFLVDLNGYVTKKIYDLEKENENNLPIITDNNNTLIMENQRYFQATLVKFIIDLFNKLPENNIHIKKFYIPAIQCQELQYKMEKIFKQEIETSQSEDIKMQISDILYKYNEGELTIEESLNQLDIVKKNEDLLLSNVNSQAVVKWEKVFVPKECNLFKVNREINVITEDNYEIYFDSKNDIDMQINNLNAILKETDINNIQYIDLRYEDRIYYK